MKAYKPRYKPSKDIMEELTKTSSMLLEASRQKNWQSVYEIAAGQLAKDEVIEEYLYSVVECGRDHPGVAYFKSEAEDFDGLLQFLYEFDIHILRHAMKHATKEQREDRQSGTDGEADRVGTGLPP